MLKDTRIAFIGAGAMGGAMISGLLSRKLVAPDQIVAADPHEEITTRLHEIHGVGVTTDNVAACEGADIVVLSVKPQVLPQVFSGLAGRIPVDAIVISIVAGASITAISEGLQHQSVVRSMPNTPAQIGEGITVWTESGAVETRQHQQAETALQALGREVFLDDEDCLDMATALSGTGPSYVFLFMEALVDAGVHLGFSRKVAEELVHHTVKGSADFVLQSPKHLARLRDQVTSPGGTSAEALYYLEKAGFRTALSRAVWAAYQRSIELGRGGKRHRLGNSAKSG